MNVLIIEDEARSARELQAVITAVNPAVKIIGVLESVEQSLNWLASNPQPDLIFSDIQLADGLSFEIYESVRITCPIIFCTAFDEYLMNAFDTNAISYLLKPINEAKVQKAFLKLNTLLGTVKKEESDFRIERLLASLKKNYKTTLLVSHREKIIPVQVKDIAYVCLDTTLIRMGTFQNQQYFMTSSMDELEKMLDPELFFRANRQFLINRNAIGNVEKFFTRKLAVKLTVETPERILVSKTKAPEFLHWLEGL
ncbi:LytTR family two component transcriptional regulator [Mucilaginibacter oryzae]|uniref:LytTR family two component transcriptional regulator n=1 Tax=Mucilaginibacter oryzae TaxID=468058 RepID=A0A316HDH2_9SPHI|nr:LytTR family DNA-binding domain-containing protein [Mucilaginibacter oryzae]PWK79204.1 LytTR family two component transcriptional regulator [Mucilaginibacter oryzae]